MYHHQSTVEFSKDVEFQNINLRTRNNSCWGESESKVVNEVQNVSHNEALLEWHSNTIHTDVQ